MWSTLTDKVSKKKNEDTNKRSCSRLRKTAAETLLVFQTTGSLHSYKRQKIFLCNQVAHKHCERATSLAGSGTKRGGLTALDCDEIMRKRYASRCFGLSITVKEETFGVNARKKCKRKKVRTQLGIPSLGDAGSNPGLILTMEEGAAETETLELLSVHKENHPHSSSVTGRLVCKGTITLSRHVNEGEATGVIRVGDITLLLCHIVRKSEANKVQRAPFQNQATIMIPRHVFFCCSRPQRSTASAGNINKGEPGRTTKQVKKNLGFAVLKESATLFI